MSTMYRLVTWDTAEDSLTPIAVWVAPPAEVELDDVGYFVDLNNLTEYLEAEFTPEEFEKKYGLPLKSYCQPGGKFSMRGEVSWVCHQADKRLL